MNFWLKYKTVININTHQVQVYLIELLEFINFVYLLYLLSLINIKIFWERNKVYKLK